MAIQVPDMPRDQTSESQNNAMDQPMMTDASRSSGTPPQASDDDSIEAEALETIQVCIFELSDRLLGVKIVEVQEIMEQTEVTPVPTTPHFLCGVTNLRGNIVPIVDIRDILHLPVKPRTRESRIMILNINTLQIGIFVDAIKEIRHLEKRIIEAQPLHIGTEGRFISTIIEYHEGILALLNLDSLYETIQL
ncbi:hypothetical protein GF339_04300 [candidate division KSB3 bacterium]|uniref:CheW-like domain-containing protein n=1 Tax=candidate division KSB3 bacterium TaxID=2044937 RepID=A0A9D5JTM1_9BACT|nr:hypothetical protein [candidate division KSB3 bacterium]MBD3323781.1 hypothetical protein [candidate division KSB3 bacterium]